MISLHSYCVAAVNSTEKEEVRRSKKDRIVKVEESRTIKIHRRNTNSEVKDDEQQEGSKGSVTEDVKMEVDQGRGEVIIFYVHCYMYMLLGWSSRIIKSVLKELELGNNA